MANFRFTQPVETLEACHLLPHRVAAPGDVQKYLWVLPAVDRTKPFEFIPTAPSGPTIIRNEYQMLMIAILSSLDRQNNNTPYDSTPGPLQLHIENPNLDIGLLEEYENPFKHETTGRLFRKHSALIITGLPGIGKTRFLRLIFHLRISANLPTLFMYRRDSALLYRDGQFGILRGGHGIEIEHLKTNLPPDTWCLVHTHYELVTVPLALVRAGFFIVQAASACKDSFAYEKYLKDLSQFCIMRPWSAEELVDGSKILKARNGLTPEAVRAFHARFGGSARHAFKESMEPKKFHDSIRAAAVCLESRCIHSSLYGSIMSFAMPIEAAHVLWSISPATDDDRRLVRVGPPSEEMLDLVLAQYSENREEARRVLFKLCLAVNTIGSRLLAADILEHHFRSLLLKGGAWPLFPIAKRGKNLASKYSLKISSATMEISAHEDTTPDPAGLEVEVVQLTPHSASTMTLRSGVYYHPSYPNLATFDSFFCGKQNQVIAFQASVAATHDMKPTGLEWLRSKGIWEVTYIYITADGTVPNVKVPVHLQDMIVASYYLRLEMQPQQGTSGQGVR